MKQFYGCLVPIDIYLDGNRVGSVKSNKSIKIDTTYGNHKLSFNLWSGNGMYDINIAKGENVKVTFKLSMGLVTSEPEIISIEKINFGEISFSIGVGCSPSTSLLALKKAKGLGKKRIEFFRQFF